MFVECVEKMANQMKDLEALRRKIRARGTHYLTPVWCRQDYSASLSEYEGESRGMVGRDVSKRA